jgi:hypothetical protein
MYFLLVRKLVNMFTFIAKKVGVGKRWWKYGVVSVSDTGPS